MCISSIHISNFFFFLSILYIYTIQQTLQKLALPGLLFHHVTPTKDYIHDKLQPYVHYIPIREDLSDLKEKYLWAEANPVEAKRISKQATEFVRRLGTLKGMQEMFNEFFERPLHQALDAYQPLEEDQDWSAVVEDSTDLRPVIQCGGYGVVPEGVYGTANDCEIMGN